MRLASLPRRPSLLLPTALAFVGCATYPERTSEAFDAFQRGHFEHAALEYADRDVTDSAFLSGAEAGAVALAAGDWDDALDHLHRAADAVEDLERRALVSAASLGEGMASWALNDTAKPYRGEGFERVYVHCGLALAYLASGRLDDVWVEVALANKLLEAEEELYEKEYRAGGFGHFLSALAYEILGQPDEAYVDYRRMVEKDVGTRLAGRALVRIANEEGWLDEARAWEQRFGPDTVRPAGAANIVVIAGVGCGPIKEEGRLIVPTPDGVIPFAVPTYARRHQWVDGMRLRLASGETVRTDVLEDVSDVAEQNLADRLAWMAAKSAARGLLKRELTQKLEAELGLGGRALGEVFAIASERADLRGWQTLPDTWQACRMFVPPGAHRLTLEAVGGARSHLGTFALEEGETMLILARTVQGRLYAHAIGGQPLGGAVL